MINNNRTITTRFKQWRASLSKGEFGFLFLFALLFVPYFINSFRIIETRIGLSGFTEYNEITLTIIGILVALPWFNKKIKIRDFAFFIMALVLYFGSALIYPDTQMAVADNGEYFVWNCLIMYFIGVSVDIDRHRTPFLWMARMATFLMYLFMLFFGMEENDHGEIEYMGYAYIFLPWVLVLVWKAIDHYRWYDIVLAILAVFMLLSMGTRGPIVCVAVFIVFYIIFAKHFKRDILTKSIIALMGYLVYYFSEIIALFFMGISKSLGFSTRVFEHLLSKEISDSGRDDIADMVIQAIKADSSGFGYGLFSDRNFITNDWYAHNLELELLCNFGRVGGSVAIVLLILFIYRSYVSVNSKDGFAILLVFFCSSIVMLQMSGSYLGSSMFYLFLGICASAICHKNADNLSTFNK